MFSRNSDRRKWALEIVRYGAAGLANTAVAAATYSALILFTHTPYFVANFLGVIASVISGYFLSRYFVFQQSTSATPGSTWRYVCVMLLQYLSGTAVIALLVASGVGELPAYFVALPIMIALSFWLQRTWVFAAPKG